MAEEHVAADRGRLWQRAEPGDVVGRDTVGGERVGRVHLGARRVGDAAIVVAPDAHGVEVADQRERLGRPERTAGHVAEIGDHIGFPARHVVEDGPERGRVAMNVAKHRDPHECAAFQASTITRPVIRSRCAPPPFLKSVISSASRRPTRPGTMS